MQGFRPGHIAFFILGLLALFAVLAMGGCASTHAVQPVSNRISPPQPSAQGWWYESFKIDWPKGQAPAWSMDLLIAHQIIKPVLIRYGNEIVLWRFHRRAVRDSAGDQFSFIFYTTAQNARKIYAAIGSNPVLGQLLAKGLIVQVITDDTNKITRPKIEDTSDPNWSKPLQKAWPFFIMGASQTWLDLISQYAGRAKERPRSLNERVSFYQKIDQKVDATWTKEGGHAFLHHLDALFGYGPLDVVVHRKVKLQF